MADPPQQQNPEGSGGIKNSSAPVWMNEHSTLYDMATATFTSNGMESPVGNNHHQSQNPGAVEGHAEEMQLFHLCYNVLGNTLWNFKTLDSLVDDTIDKLVSFNLSEHPNAAEKAKVKQKDSSMSMLRTLTKLSAFPRVQESLYNKVKVAMEYYMFVGTSEVKELCGEILRNLSRCVSNKLPIFFAFANLLVDCLTNGETPCIRRYAIGTMNNIATCEQIALELMQRSTFIQIVVDLVRNGDSVTIKERAIWTLQSMACADGNEVALFEAPNVIQSLIQCLVLGETPEIKSYAVETLRNLAPQNKTRMFANRQLVEALLNLLRPDSPLWLKLLVFSCFERMGIDRIKVQAFRRVTTLSSVRELPRLTSNRNCAFVLIPPDLLRKISDVLYDR